MNAEQFYEIYDIYVTPWWKTQEFLLLACATLLVLCGLLIYLFIRLRRKKITPPLSAWERARLELDALDLARCASKDDFKAFYFSLTGILKRYLDARYGWGVMSLTDDEIEPYLLKKSFNQDYVREIGALFRGSISVRFANLNALPDQALQDLNRVKAIVEATVPQQADK